jgi:predicted amidohydrolase YtcJ
MVKTHNPGIILFIAIFITACSEDSPDTTVISEQTQAQESSTQIFADAIYRDALIYTVNEANPWAEALAIKDGVIMAIGPENEINNFLGPETANHDLNGRMLMPGIHDTHSHPVEAGITALYDCSFLSMDLSEVLAIIRSCVTEAEPGQWITGGQWNDSIYSDGRSPKEILDEITTDHPVLFMDWSFHNAWVNSKALEMLDIDNDTENPDKGVIVRNMETGEATGVLFDNAAYNARKMLPKYSLDQNKAAISWATDQMLQYGITTYKDAIVTRESLDAYIALDKNGLLKNRVKTSLTWKSAWASSHESELETIDSRSTYTSDYLDTDFAKIMLDGIPPTYTAALIEPYMPSEQHGDDYRGIPMLDAEELIEDVVALDAKGVTVKIHATGDLAVRMALDAFEAARNANGDNGLIHEVSHAELIHADDIARFKELNVAPEMCPILWYPAALGDLRPLLGEGRHQFWQIKTLIESGALVIYGSDWPVVPRPNPWPGIESMVTRMDPSGQDPTVGWTDEAVDLETAIRIFTVNSAIANKDGDSSGSLDAGKNADFIILDRNIFDIPIDEVGETNVLLTVVNGKHVYGSIDE